MVKSELVQHVTAALVVLGAIGYGAEQAGTSPSTKGQACKPEGRLMEVAGLAEASGLAPSRITPGRLWAHGDSGAPEVVALDARGKVTGRVSLPDATRVDWEAVASGPCSSGSCLYLADIGDNAAERKEIAIYRIPEPSTPDGSMKVDGVFRATYPDGEHDAETLLASPKGRLFVVTKGETGDISVYRFPADLRTDVPMALERVGGPLSSGQPAPQDRITDGAISPDGQWVALRTRSTLMFYRAAEFLNGDFNVAARVDLSALAEPQGEAVAFGDGNTVYLAGEGGGNDRPSTLAVLTCTK